MKEIKNQIIKSLQIQENLIIQISNEEELINLISKYIEELINNNFEHLLWVLYKLDVNENKIKKTINNNNLKNSSILIAKLIVEREIEKIKTRKEYKTKENNEWIF